MPTQSGIFHETYDSDMQLRPTTGQRIRLALVVALVILIPFIVSESEVRIVNRIIIAAIGAIGLNVLTGYTGTNQLRTRRIPRSRRIQLWLAHGSNGTC